MNAMLDTLPTADAPADVDALAGALHAPEQDGNRDADIAADSGNNGNKPSRTRHSGRSRSKRTPGTAGTDGGNSAEATIPAGFPGMDRRPCYGVYDSALDSGQRAGVYFHGIRQGKGESPPAAFDAWIGAPLHVEAMTADEAGARSFGKVLRFRDSLGRWKAWAMPATMLAGDGAELARELLDQGYVLDSEGARPLRRYLIARDSDTRLVSCTRTGWHGQGETCAFVFPNATVGCADYVFQAEGAPAAAFALAGTLDGWRSEVAALCADNPLLVLAVSAAFAAPLMQRAGVEHGGIHLHGPSSSGKTTALRVAASVWGGDAYRRTWRATANGLEGAAALANDALLALDEIGEADPEEVGAVIYAIGNGTGKTRADRTGRARSPSRWRTLLLSTGERAAADVIRDGGRRRQLAGQAVRVLDIGAHDGLIRSHAGFASAGALAEALAAAAQRHHGHAGRAFVAHLLADARDVAAELREIADSDEFRQTDGQARRAARVLALVGMAGELATGYGLTGWPAGAALDAAAEALALWLAARGGRGQPLEHVQTLARLRDWLAAHGEAGFTSADSDAAPPARERFGWWRDAGGARTWYLLPAALDRALDGIDRTAAVGHLERAGWIAQHDLNRRTKKLRVGASCHNVYAVCIPEAGGDE